VVPEQSISPQVLLSLRTAHPLLTVFHLTAAPNCLVVLLVQGIPAFEDGVLFFQSTLASFLFLSPRSGFFSIGYHEPRTPLFNTNSSAPLPPEEHSVPPSENGYGT